MITDVSACTPEETNTCTVVWFMTVTDSEEDENGEWFSFAQGDGTESKDWDASNFSHAMFTAPDMYEWFTDTEKEPSTGSAFFGGSAGGKMKEEPEYNSGSLTTFWAIELSANEGKLGVGSSHTITLGGGWVNNTEKVLFTGAVPVYAEILSGAATLAMGSLAVIAAATI